MTTGNESSGALHVVRSARATFQDLGRPLGEQLGLSVNGAADQFASRAANLLVGNPESLPLCEMLVFDFEAVARTAALLAVTGLDCVLTIDGQPRDCWEPQPVSPGQRIRVVPGRQGARAYLAVHGGLMTSNLLGSCAPDPVVGFDQAIQPGSDLLFPRPFGGFTQRSLPVFRLAPPPRRPGDVWPVALVPVAGDGGLPDLRHQLESTFTVGPASNQIGLRLSGPVLTGVPRHQLLSRGIPVGAIEVPPSGEVIVLLRGRFVTAGYPIVAVVSSASLDLLGQARPGQRLRFTWQSRAASVLAYRHERNQLTALGDRARAALRACGLALSGPAAC